MWDFSDSMLLYIPGAEETYEEIQHVENPYYQLVTKPERQYLESIAASVVSELPSTFEYIDLGPGTEHKEQFVFDEARRQHKEFSYIPVDISTKFLKLSADYATEQGIPTHSLRVPFEALPLELKDEGTPRFVSLGLTYSNYEPKVILELLKSIAGESGSAFINSQIRDRVDMGKIKEIYSGDVVNIAKPKLELLGLDLERDVADLNTDNGIKAWCTLRQATPKLERMGISAGAKLLIFQSLRPTRESLERDIAAIFPSYTLLDTGTSFVGALLKNTK